jgi:hypothetical protein
MATLFFVSFMFYVVFLNVKAGKAPTLDKIKNIEVKKLNSIFKRKANAVPTTMAKANVVPATKVQKLAPSAFATSEIDYDVPTYQRKGVHIDFNKKPTSKKKRSVKRAPIQSEVVELPEMVVDTQEPNFEIIA